MYTTKKETMPNLVRLGTRTVLFPIFQLQIGVAVAGTGTLPTPPYKPVEEYIPKLHNMPIPISTQVLLF
jgi:hypothetical protein